MIHQSIDNATEPPVCTFSIEKPMEFAVELLILIEILLFDGRLHLAKEVFKLWKTLLLEI